jgi:hypothetical protein
MTIRALNLDQLFHLKLLQVLPVHFLIQYGDHRVVHLFQTVHFRLYLVSHFLDDHYLDC